MKISKYLLASTLLLSLSAGLYSCGSGDDNDDDNDGGKTISSGGVIDKSSGLRIKSVDSSGGIFTFLYDNKGRIDHINLGSSEFCTFTYDPNRIVYDHWRGSGTFGFNGSGLLANKSSSGNSGSHTYSGTFTFTYDSSGHLTKISGSTQSSTEEYGEEISQTSYSLTWRNNLL